MAPDMKSLQGLFNWSMQFQGGQEREKPSQMSDEEYNEQKMKWLANALDTFSQVQDPAARMRQIKMALDLSSGRSNRATVGDGSHPPTGAETSGAQQPSLALSLEDEEALLEELADWVTSIDHARDLHAIGGLPTLLGLMDNNTAPSLRWRAAEVAATCMANNPAVQQWFLDGGLLPKLLGLLDAEPHGLAQQQQQQQQKVEQDGTSAAQGSSEQQQGGSHAEDGGKQHSDGELCAALQVKALLALSALIRHCKPALELFRLEGGLLRLVNLAGSPDTRVQRKALMLLQYLLAQHPQDTAPAVQYGCLGPCVQALQEARDVAAAAQKSPSADGFTLDELAQVERAGAALGLMNEAARSADGWQALKGQKMDGLVAELHVALEQLPSPEYKESVEAEQGLASRLHKALAGPLPPPAAAVAPKTDHVPASRDQKPEEPVTLTTQAGQHVSQPGDAEASQGGNKMGLCVVPENRF
ncbi:armadillo-type protein [Dunaliella salina]|uniref:Armadillo-type protein n=1 Tax=Dunaliella salina TaxID=3046 RepID=A0ABQ7GGV0_DUNSA|nr:armadillo-type protein [Dunaliella salina]|eukprot:KAF5833821.1 armadillo-type protein [Dunaliella salina]